MNAQIKLLLFAGTGLFVVSTAFAQPKPLNPTDTKAPAHFPMSSTQFRPLFDKAIAQLEALAAKAPNAEDRSKAQAVIAHGRIQASIAMEDGVVTRAEASRIFTDRRRF